MACPVPSDRLRTQRTASSTPARLVGALVASLLTVGASEARAQSSDDPHAASQARFEHGSELFRHHDYPQALAEFQAAADLVRTPNILLATGLCLARMGQEAGAYNAFTEASALAVSLSDPRYGDTARRAEHEASALEPHLARLDLHVSHPPEGLVVRVEGESTPSTGWNRPVAYPPGDVTVTATAPGFQEFHQSVHLTVGQQSDLTLALDAEAVPAPPPEPVPVPVVVPEPTPPAPTPPVEAPQTASPGRGLRIAGWVTGGVGLAGIAGFALFGSMASSRFNSLQTACHMGPCPASDNSQIDTGVAWQTTANVSLGVGAGLVGVGAVLLILGATRHADTDATAPTDAPSRLDAWIDPSHASLGVRGAF